MTAEAELKHLKLHSSKELQQAREDLLERLEQTQATAEQRVEEHTEEYRLQVCMFSQLCCRVHTYVALHMLSRNVMILDE